MRVELDPNDGTMPPKSSVPSFNLEHSTIPSLLKYLGGFVGQPGSYPLKALKEILQKHWTNRGWSLEDLSGFLGIFESVGRGDRVDELRALFGPVWVGARHRLSRTHQISGLIQAIMASNATALFLVSCFGKYSRDVEKDRLSYNNDLAGNVYMRNNLPE
jgi:hypothetical protein